MLCHPVWATVAAHLLLELLELNQLEVLESRMVTLQILLGCPRREAGSIRDRDTAQHVHGAERHGPPGAVDQARGRRGAKDAGGLLPHSRLHQSDM